MNTALHRLATLISGSPYASDLWLVGGFVRDELLGLPAKTDVDLVTTLPLDPLIALISPAADHAPVVYERFRTAMVTLDGQKLEFVTARRESYEPDSRKPFVESATLEEDALRRDFTVNALFQNLLTGEVLDPTGLGLADLKAKILRTPKEPKATFHDDPLRMLRAVRLRWQLGFEPAAGLYEAIRETADRLAVISPERFREEFNKILLGPHPAKALAEMMELNLFHHYIPEFEAMVGVDQGNYHHLDVWNHTLLVLQNLGPSDDLPLKLAALLHDVGKPETKTIDSEGKIRFFSHEVVGAKIGAEILRKLKYSGDEIAVVSRLVRNHMRLGSAPVFTASAARRLLKDLDEDVPRLLALVDADSRALKKGVRSFDLAPIESMLAHVQEETPTHTLVSPLTGTQIGEILGLEPSPAVGRAKDFLVERVLEGELKADDRKEAERLLREVYSPEGNSANKSRSN